jgi:hypothetical protein
MKQPERDGTSWPTSVNHYPHLLYSIHPSEPQVVFLSCFYRIYGHRKDLPHAVYAHNMPRSASRRRGVVGASFRTRVGLNLLWQDLGL